jgi:hypothetical protein
MKMTTFLLSGIAGLAVASAVSFGAYAQTDATSPAAATPQATDSNATGGQTPATAPSVERVKQRHHHGIYRGQSGPQDSTPAEKAATDLLNQQQLTAGQLPAQPPVATPPPPPPSTPPTP